LQHKRKCHNNLDYRFVCIFWQLSQLHNNMF